MTEKIDRHQDRIKSRNEWSLIECINMQCDAEGKELIREQVAIPGNPSLLFMFQSPIVKSKSDARLTSAETITNEIYK